MSATHLYSLKSLKSDKLYVGVTSRLEERLERHHSGRVQSSKKDAPYKLVYAEVCRDLRHARVRERYFETGQGRRAIKNKYFEGGPP